MQSVQYNDRKYGLDTEEGFYGEPQQTEKDCFNQRFYRIWTMLHCGAAADYFGNESTVLCCSDLDFFESFRI